MRGHLSFLITRALKESSLVHIHQITPGLFEQWINPRFKNIFNSHPTRIPYPHMSWQKIAKHTEMMLMRHRILNLLHCVLNIIATLSSSRKSVISGSFLVYEILKLLFPIFVHITKRRRIKFERGSLWVFMRSNNVLCLKSRFLTSSS